MIIDDSEEKSNNSEIDKNINSDIEKGIPKSKEINLFDQELNNYYLDINNNHYLPKGTIIESKGKAFSSIINLLKKTLNRIFYPSLAYMIGVQNVFNSNVVKILNALRERINSSFHVSHAAFDWRLRNNEDAIKELEKKLLEMNHYRYMEIKNLENFIHNELLDVKAELGNLVYTYLYLQNNFNDAILGIKELQKALRSHDELLIHNENRINELRVSKEQLLMKHESIINELQNKVAHINETISGIPKLSGHKQISPETDTSKIQAKPERETISNETLDYIYYDLENILRGSEEEIRQRQQDYLKYMKNDGPVLDIGCGRGELLELLLHNGFESMGVDSNKLMVDYCISKGLKATQAEGISYLSNLKDESLGGLTAFHFIEHLDSNSLCSFLITALRKIKDGGILILETPNPLGSYTLSRSFYLDFSHLRPVHPNALKLLLESIGFTVVKLMYLSPWEDAIKLTPIISKAGDRVVEIVKENFDKLNEIIFSPRDYSIIAKK